VAQRYLIVTKDQYGGVFVVGTHSGTFFRSEERAEKVANQIVQAQPRLAGAIAVPVMAFNVEEGIFDPNEGDLDES